MGRHPKTFTEGDVHASAAHDCARPSWPEDVPKPSLFAANSPGCRDVHGKLFSETVDLGGEDRQPARLVAMAPLRLRSRNRRTSKMRDGGYDGIRSDSRSWRCRMVLASRPAIAQASRSRGACRRSSR